MKGMTLDQYKEVVEFVQEFHKFAGYKPPIMREAIKEIYPNINEYGLGIKYINSNYDTRTQDIWSITLNNVQFRTNNYTTINPAPEGFNYDNLYDLCMDYLKGNFEPTEEFKIK